MRTFLFTLLLFLGLSAHAGPAKLTWSHDFRATDGSTVALTGFNVYYSVNGGPEQLVQIGPPMPQPWKTENGVSIWSKTLDIPEGLPGYQVCFQMTAVAGTQESGRSNQACKVFPQDPNAPVIIDIDRP